MIWTIRETLILSLPLSYTHVHSHTLTHIHTHIQSHTHTYTHIHTQTHTHTQTQTHTQTYIHTQTNTQTRTLNYPVSLFNIPACFLCVDCLMSLERTFDLLTAKVYNFFPSVGTYVTYDSIMFVCSHFVE